MPLDRPWVPLPESGAGILVGRVSLQDSVPGDQIQNGGQSRVTIDRQHDNPVHTPSGYFDFLLQHS